MQVPDRWCTECPGFQSLLTGPVVMLGQDWYADGRHRYRARIRVTEGTPFTAIQAAASKMGVRSEWDKNAGWLRIKGSDWSAMASLGGGPEFALGTFVEVMGQFQADATNAQAEARKLAKKFDPFARFVELADQESAQISAVTLLEFARPAAVFGYLEVYKEGFRSFLSTELKPWLEKTGFTQQASQGNEVWTLRGAQPVTVSVSVHDPDKLRVDVAGRAEFETMRVGSPGGLEAGGEGPPDQGAVLARAFCLAAIAERLLLEMHWKSASEAERADFAKRNAALGEWLRSEGLYDSLSADERQLLFQPVGGWIKPHHVAMSWRIESLGVLSWALGLTAALPPYDIQFTQKNLQALLPVMEPTTAVAARVRLAPFDVLDAARAKAHEWHQRAVAVEGQFSASRTQPSFLGKAANRLFGGGPAVADRASATASPCGKPFGDLTFEEFSTARSIALERHYALTWLCTGGPWDDVTVNG